MKPNFEVGDLVKVGIDEDGYFTPWNSSTQHGATSPKQLSIHNLGNHCHRNYVGFWEVRNLDTQRLVDPVGQ